MEIMAVNRAVSVYTQSTKMAVSQTVSIEQTTELSEAEKLEAFKKEIWNEINSYSWNKSMNISIQITDGAFKRIMNDADFKDRMLGVIKKESIAAQPPGNTSLTWIDESGYRGFSYIDVPAGEMAFTAHSNDKDSFYVKKAAKKRDYAEMWEEKQLERERQREKLDNEYVKKLYYNRSVLRKGQVSAAYEANVVEQPVESNRFDSTTTGKNAEFQKKCQNKININLQDCVELSCVKEFVLTSENYNDIMKSEWISHEGAHEAIIGPELWEAVQKINRATKQISTNNTPPQIALFPKPILTASQPLSENTPALKNSTASCFTN